MKKNTVFILSMLLALGALAALILCPAQAAASAVHGLQVCMELIVPSLFPFLVISRLLSAVGVSDLLSRAVARPTERLFGISGEACVPFFLGLCGGYPVGAMAVGTLVRDGRLSAAEGERILPFCNNTGPAFIIGAAGGGVFGSGKYGLLLYLSHVAAAVCVAVVFSAGRRPRRSATPITVHPTGLASALPACVQDAMTASINICGFIIFFSVITGILSHLGVLSAISDVLVSLFSLPPRFSLCLVTGILELGGGVSAMKGLSASPAALALASFLLGFGGLAVHCQTLCAVEGTQIKCARHFAGRLLHAGLSALFSFFVASLM